MDENELRRSLAALHSASFAWAVVCCRNRELAEEVLQSVYVKVLDKYVPSKEREGATGGSSFRTWLFAVIRNAARDELRRRWWSRVIRMDLKSLAELTPGEMTNSPEEEEVAMIRAAVGKLPKRQREVAHLVFYENLTVADAAKVMGVTVGAARQHYARAKASLKISLKPLQNQKDEPLVG